MSKLEVLIFPHPCLRQVAKPVDKISADLKHLMDDMAETMYEAPGIGLAAPQIGISQRVIVIDVDSLLPEGAEKIGLLKLINPEIIERVGLSRFDEGCLSLPGLTEEIERAATVRARFTDPDGNTHEIQAQGIMATVLQHEIDHLDGVLILDYLSPLKRSRYKAKLKKELKNLQREDSSDDQFIKV